MEFNMEIKELYDELSKNFLLYRKLVTKEDSEIIVYMSSVEIKEVTLNYDDPMSHSYELYINGLIGYLTKYKDNYFSNICIKGDLNHGYPIETVLYFDSYNKVMIYLEDNLIGEYSKTITSVTEVNFIIKFANKFNELLLNKLYLDKLRKQYDNRKLHLLYGNYKFLIYDRITYGFYLSNECHVEQTDPDDRYLIGIAEDLVCNIHGYDSYYIMERHLVFTDVYGIIGYLSNYFDEFDLSCDLYMQLFKRLNNKFFELALSEG